MRDVFFSGPAPLDVEPLIERIGDSVEVVRTLVGARRLSASIPDSTLIPILESADSELAWSEYAWLGGTEARTVLNRNEELSSQVARAALYRAPDAVLPRLLEAACHDTRPLNSFPDHPLRLIETWARAVRPGRGEAVPRRQVLLRAIEEYKVSGGSAATCVLALQYVMDPGFEFSELDPGQGTTTSMLWGVLGTNELNELQQLWPRVRELVCASTPPTWKHAVDLVTPWSHPHRFPGAEMPADVRTILRATAAQMIGDLASAGADLPSVLRRLEGIANDLGIELPAPIDQDFSVLFPFVDRKDPRRSLDAASQRVKELAIRWSALAPGQIVGRLAKWECEARMLGLSWPRFTSLLCQELAERVSEPTSWLREGANSGLSADLIGPFLVVAASTGRQGWEEIATDLVEQPASRAAVIEAVLTKADCSSELLSKVLKRLEGFGTLIETICLRGEVRDALRQRLLEHEDAAIACAAAGGEWYAAKNGQVPDDLLPAWRQAVVRCKEDKPWLSEALGRDRQLAFGWLKGRLKEKDPWYHALNGPAHTALGKLHSADRIRLLDFIDKEFRDGEFLARLIGDDLELYQRLLSRDDLKAFQLSPLEGYPMGCWQDKAKLALAAGYEPRQVASAAMSGVQGGNRKLSLQSQNWLSSFEELRSGHDDLREVAECGIEIARRRLEIDEQLEREEEVFGFEP